MPRSARTLLLSLLLLACVAGTADAQAPSINLNWDQCLGDGRIADRTFACNTNTGEDVIVLSMVLHDSTRTGLGAFGIKIDISPVAAAVPQWWQTLTGQCRGNALGVQFDFVDVALPPSSCPPWHGSTPSLSVNQFLYKAPDKFYADGIAAVPAGQEVTLLVGQEYMLARFRIRHTKSVGNGACQGCMVPACIGVSQITLQYPSPHPNDYFEGAGLNSVTWQGGYVASYPTVSPAPCSHPSLCPYINRLQCTTAPVPAQGRTWGVIKTLYR